MDKHEETIVHLSDIYPYPKNWILHQGWLTWPWKKGWLCKDGTIAGYPVVFFMSKQNWNPALRVQCALCSTMLLVGIHYSLICWSIEGSFLRWGTKKWNKKGSFPNKASIFFLFRTTLWWSSPVVQLSLLLDQITNLKSSQENLLLMLFVWELEKLSSSQANLLLILFVMELENYLHVLQLDTSLPFFCCWESC